MCIEWLGTQRCDTRSLTGGKAAGLSVLARKYNVPAGFCISVGAYEKWQACNPQSASVPRKISELIRGSYQKLCDRRGVCLLPVAVRSSSILEDGSGLSFAGLYESVLNVVGAGKVKDAVLACWVSARSDRVRDYIGNNGIMALPGMAVLVQEFISGTASAVAFSANPVTADRGEVVINANWGVGTSIVEGTATPDHYIVSKKSLRILEKRVVDKRKMSVPIVGGGTTVGEVPVQQCKCAALLDSQMKEVAALAVDLEVFLGFPVDIETTFKNEELFLLQCRPVTGLTQKVKQRISQSMEERYEWF